MTLLSVAQGGAWIGGALLFGWIIRDAWRTSRDYDENLLLSSREGEIDSAPAPAPAPPSDPT